VIGGHHIHIETSRHCNSAACVSVSIPGVYEKRARRDRYDDEVRDVPPPARPVPVAPLVSTPPVQPVVCAPAAPLARPVAPVAPQA
jgi:hypothetical protein